MSDTIAIKIENLTKTYKLYDSPLDHLKEIIHPLRKKYHHDFDALHGVSFEVKRGETVGIIGKNGSGKSTLLKLITGVLTPTSGAVAVKGKVSALLELGAGFNPELTGLENVYYYGIVTGFTREQMDRKLEDILSFADIGEFVHQPVKTYSSGMFVRLAFSVAIAVEPDVLVIDEALAVGDLAFQLKCVKKLENFSANGVTILFVSHDTNAVKKFCSNSIWLNGGKIESAGKSSNVVDRYTDYLKVSASSEFNTVQSIKRDTNRISSIRNIVLLDATLAGTDSFATNDDIILSINYEVFIEIPDLVVGVAVFDMARNYICGMNTKLDSFKPSKSIGANSVVLKLNAIKLLGGRYFLDVGLFENTTIVAFDYISKAIEFTVSDDSNTEGFVLLDHQWQHLTGDAKDKGGNGHES